MLKKILLAILAVPAALFVTGFLVSLVSGGAKNQTSLPNENHRSPRIEKQATDAPSLPSDEETFVSTIKSSQVPYKDAPNELKKSALRSGRASSIRTALNGKRKFTNWIGKLESMSTTSDGHAVVSVSIADDLHLKTWNNAVSDVGDKTLIHQDNPMYSVISELKEGTTVRFSGEFLPSKQDFVKEGSISEEGSMTDPEFIVRFSSIEPN